MKSKLHKKDFKIALVGVEFEENLSLRYLAGSLISEGYENVSILKYNGLQEAEEIVDTILQNNVDLVGISMVFQVRAIEDMTFVQLLRKQGFKNHITAGGQFATLHYNEIFDDCNGLDSIIRFEAETVIVQLANALNEQSDLTPVPALIWKDENQHLHINHATITPDNINNLPFPLRNTERPRYLGLRSSHLIGSRGCHATCKYCCVSALARERRNASRESGGSTAIPGTRRRSVESITEEIAHLYFDHDVRIFEFQDDNWIHPKVSVAIEYFTDLKKALDDRGIGQIGFTLKMRADSVQPEILQVLKELGLIRVFVGIESGTQNLLSKLGRKSRDNVSLKALQLLREYKIPAYFNALLFGPDINFDEIETELAFLDQCKDFPFEVVEVVIYGKTGLYQGLKSQERLLGNYLDYEYNYLDDKTQQVHTIISQLETRHFGVYSPIKMAADLGFNLGILQVFYPGEKTNMFAKAVAELNQKINTDQIVVLRKAIAYVENGLPIQKIIDALIAETLAADLQFYREIIQLHQKMEHYVQGLTKKENISSYYRTGAVVQSNLLAGIFMLCLNSTFAQDNGSINEELKKDLIELVYDYNHKDWKDAKERLNESKIPISNYLRPVKQAVDSINTTPNGNAELSAINFAELNKDIGTLREKRIKNDYKRLKDILLEHNPKIKIASTLDLYLDKNGYVTNLYLNGYGRDKRKKEFSQKLKEVILELLKEKQFYSYEARGILTSPANARRKLKESKKRFRRGPLD